MTDAEHFAEVLRTARQPQIHMHPDTLAAMLKAMAAEETRDAVRIEGIGIVSSPYVERGVMIAADGFVDHGFAPRQPLEVKVVP